MTTESHTRDGQMKIRTYGLVQVRVNGGAPELGSSEASCCVADPDVRVVHQRWVTPGVPQGGNGSRNDPLEPAPSHYVALEQRAPGTDVRLFEHLRLGESGGSLHLAAA